MRTMRNRVSIQNGRTGKQDSRDELRDMYDNLGFSGNSAVSAVPLYQINRINGISCLKPEGAFYVMMNIRSLLGRSYNGRVLEDSMDFAELLLAEKHVAVVPGIAFEAEGFCRLSYAVSTEKIEEGLSRIEAFINELK